VNKIARKSSKTVVIGENMILYRTDVGYSNGIYNLDFVETVYCGTDLGIAIKRGNEYLHGNQIESVCINVWEDGVHKKTLNGYGEEWDYEN
jgi:hypothetical protein